MSADAPILAVTGGTGFVGSHVIDRALAAGHRIRALARKPQAARANVAWIAGALDRPDALNQLVEGADAVIHIAGTINAADRAGFVAGNVDGTTAMVKAAERIGVERFVNVSSLAAREPALSDYGWSKARAEGIVAASTLGWTIVRPPAVFGPRDTEMRELFRFAGRRIVPLPPAGGRASLIFVRDLADLLLTLATGAGALRTIVEPDDGTPGGWDHRDMARAIGAAVGKRVLPLPLPPSVFGALARIDRAVRGDRARLTPDRVGYFRHPDWVAHLPPSPALWRAATPTPAALAETARWYRVNGLL